VRETIRNYSQAYPAILAESWQINRIFPSDSMFSREIRFFCTAWMFFTRIPLPDGLVRWVGYSPALLNGAARYFPLVGLLVGAAGAAVFGIAIWLFTPIVAVALSMAATVLLTGAFHEDGFADVCDGFGGSHEPARVMEIMKDSRVGAFGAIGIALMLLVKFSALFSLAEGTQAELLVWLLVAGHALSRVAPVTLIFALPYVRPDPDAKSKPMAASVTWTELAMALFWGMLPLAGLVYFYENAWLFLLGALPVGAVAWLMGLWFRRRIGGYTGDCLGAMQQVAEVAFYLYCVALLAGPPAGA
jgi:adenosylcobinamide-GDP ribazoletransferase